MRKTLRTGMRARLSAEMIFLSDLPGELETRSRSYRAGTSASLLERPAAATGKILRALLLAHIDVIDLVLLDARMGRRPILQILSTALLFSSLSMTSLINCFSKKNEG